MQLLDMSNTKIQYMLAFLYGMLIKIVDDLIDLEFKSTALLVNITYVLEIVLICITIYIIYFNKDLGIYLALLFVFGGIVGYLFYPHLIDAPIWVVLILIAIPKLIIEIDMILEYIQNITENDLHDILFFLGPLIVGCTIFALVEDKLVPEEVSNKKIYARSIQIISIMLFLKYYENFIDFLGINKNYPMVIFVAYPHLGYFITGLIIALSIKYNRTEAT
jgi:hypothetical protein